MYRLERRRMHELPVCDFCGRPETISQGQHPDDQRELELDQDGLWVCSDCKARLTGKPTDHPADDEGELDERIKALVGKSAGAICRTLNLPYVPPYQSIIDAASRIAYDEDRYMSAWLFVTLWMDGTTVWQSEDRSARALVSAEGTVQTKTGTS
jgi:hypothetical protein